MARIIYYRKFRFLSTNLHPVQKRFLSFLLVLSAVAGTFPALGQSGGFGTWQFLNYPTTARVAGMGGNFLAIDDHDLAVAISNPSMTDTAMNNRALLSYARTPGGINFGSAAYSRTFPKAGSFTASLVYLNYGRFEGADPAGNPTGAFHAADYALSIGWGRRLSPLFSVGATGRIIYSQMESYNAFGIAVDVAGTYTSKEQLFTASVIGRNIGTQLDAYLPGDYEPLPFEIQIGLSQKLRHIPLRFSQLLTNLQRWDLTYTDPSDPNNTADPLTGETRTKTGAAKVADGVMRHVVLGAELTIAKVLAIRLGYNYLRRQEMKLYNKAGLSGFSLGAGLKVKMFNLSYTRGTYMAGMGNNHLTLGINLQEFVNKQ